MKIRTGQNIDDEWFALDDDTYDGAEDSPNRQMVGYGATADLAIADLMRLLNEEAEWKEDEEARQKGESRERTS